LAAGELHDLERAAKAGHLLGEIFLQRRFIEPMVSANFSDFLSYGHVAFLLCVAPAFSLFLK
jgi:hypothetical protein